MIKATEISLLRATLQQRKELYDISRQTFYESFGPPVNTESDIQKYINEHITLDIISTELTNSDIYYFLLKSEKEVLGYLKLNTNASQTEDLGESTIEIERIYIRKQYQNHNLGKLLLEKAMELGVQLEKSFIWLGVWEKNIKAINFYKKSGFIPFDKHTFILGDDVQTDIMMKLNLEGN